MAERTEQVGTDVDVNDMAPRPVERDADQIAADISRTREEITQTVDEIQRKISPDELLQQTLDTIRDALSENSARVLDIIKQHPLTTALVGVGIGWLFLQGYGSTSARAYSTRRYAADYPGHTGSDTTGSDTMSSAASSIKDAAGSARDKAGQIAGQARNQAANLAGRVKEQASHIADQVKGQAGQIADQAKGQTQYVTDVARDQAVKAKDQFWSMVNDNPLGVAAMGLAMGAAIGLLLPATRTEQESLSEKARNIVDSAKEAVKEEWHT